MSRVQTIVAEVLRLPASAVTAETSMEKTDAWDSLKHMELIFRIEGDFDIELTGDEIATMTSVAAIAGVLTARGSLAE